MRAFLLLCALAAPMAAQDKLPIPVAAKFLKIFCTTDGGSGKVACAQAEMKDELEKAGVSVDGGATFAWADSPGEMQTFLKESKVVVVSTLDLLRGGAQLAIVVEGGKPAVYISGSGKANFKIPGTIKKIARSI